MVVYLSGKVSGLDIEVAKKILSVYDVSQWNNIEMVAQDHYWTTSITQTYDAGKDLGFEYKYEKEFRVLSDLILAYNTFEKHAEDSDEEEVKK